jgi:ABC-type nitrate/sulfonate/bicarbonate transport system ATPase subunit
LDHVKLSARGLVKIFGCEKDRNLIRVVDGISMDIADKELVVILGPSGCGKSTFLKMLGGILDATEGRIALDGVDYGRELPRRVLRKFGFVFQSNNLLQWRTAEGNLKFMLETMKLKGPEWSGRVQEMLEIVGLQDYKDVSPHELSGGMKQRVGIARALVHDPEVLIMDQPLGALDAITRRMLTFEILNIWEKTQKTIVMVTNNVDEALLLAHRVLVFSPLPARIIHEIPVDIPHGERGPQILADPRFLEKRARLNEIVRATMDQGGDRA